MDEALEDVKINQDIENDHINAGPYASSGFRRGTMHNKEESKENVVNFQRHEFIIEDTKERR